MNAPLTPAERAAITNDVADFLGTPKKEVPDDSFNPSFLTTLDEIEAEHRKGSRFQKIPADQIAPSKFANRLPFNYDSEVFKAFREDIKHTDGNTVPVLVRPLGDFSRKIRYELVTGHRRHRACLDLVLDVRCQVEDLTDRELVERMSAENRQRTDLCSYEKALHFQRILDAKLYATHTALAKAHHVDNSTVSKLLKLAALPPAVVQAFKSEDLIHVNWGHRLQNALEEDYDGVISRAQQLAGGVWKPIETFEALIAKKKELPPPTSWRGTVEDSTGEVLATVTVPVEARGEGVQVKFKVGAVCPRELTRALFKLMLGLEDVPEHLLPGEIPVMNHAEADDA